MDWNEAIKKEARGTNVEDFEVQGISSGQILTQIGLMNKERFAIPQKIAESYDGDKILFKIFENELLDNYRKGANEYHLGQTDNTQNCIQDNTSETTSISSTEENWMFKKMCRNSNQP